MLSPGRIPLNDAENAAVGELATRHALVGLSRRDPGEAGPVVVSAADASWEVAEDGTVTER